MRKRCVRFKNQHFDKSVTVAQVHVRYDNLGSTGQAQGPPLRTLAAILTQHRVPIATAASSVVCTQPIGSVPQCELCQSHCVRHRMTTSAAALSRMSTNNALVAHNQAGAKPDTYQCAQQQQTKKNHRFIIIRSAWRGVCAM